jgi:hypothetical protein
MMPLAAGMTEQLRVDQQSFQVGMLYRGLCSCWTVPFTLISLKQEAQVWYTGKDQYIGTFGSQGESDSGV